MAARRYLPMDGSPMDLSLRFLLVVFAISPLIATVSCSLEGDPSDLPPAPEITVEKTFGVPVGLELSWSSLSGQVVIVEFWSTTCAPCVGAIAHWNELVERFDGKPVRFLSITKEDEKTIKRFLGKRPIRGWIGLDFDGSTFASFAVGAIPHTVIVDQKGRVAGVSSPFDVTERLIQDVLVGRPLNLPPPDAQAQLTVTSDAGSKNEPPPLFQLVIRESQQDHQSTRNRPTSFEAIGCFVQDAVALAHDVPRTRVLLSEGVSDRRYDIVIHWPGDRGADPRALLAPTLGPALAISMRIEPRDVDVLVLGPTDERTLRMEENTVSGTTSYSTTSEGVLRGANVGMDALARSLEGLLAIPVLNETGLSGRYDFELPYDSANPETVSRAASEKLGLTLKKERRKVEFVVVERS